MVVSLPGAQRPGAKGPSVVSFRVVGSASDRAASVATASSTAATDRRPASARTRPAERECSTADRAASAHTTTARDPNPSITAKTRGRSLLDEPSRQMEVQENVWQELELHRQRFHLQLQSERARADAQREAHQQLLQEDREVQAEQQRRAEEQCARAVEDALTEKQAQVAQVQQESEAAVRRLRREAEQAELAREDRTALQVREMRAAVQHEVAEYKAGLEAQGRAALEAALQHQRGQVCEQHAAEVASQAARHSAELEALLQRLVEDTLQAEQAYKEEAARKLEAVRAELGARAEASEAAAAEARRELATWQRKYAECWSRTAAAEADCQRLQGEHSRRTAEAREEGDKRDMLHRGLEGMVRQREEKIVKLERSESKLAQQILQLQEELHATKRELGAEMERRLRAEQRVLEESTHAAPMLERLETRIKGTIEKKDTSIHHLRNRLRVAEARVLRTEESFAKLLSLAEVDPSSAVFDSPRPVANIGPSSTMLESPQKSVPHRAASARLGSPRGSMLDR